MVSAWSLVNRAGDCPLMVETSVFSWPSTSEASDGYPETKGSGTSAKIGPFSILATGSPALVNKLANAGGTHQRLLKVVWARVLCVAKPVTDHRIALMGAAKLTRKTTVAPLCVTRIDRCCIQWIVLAGGNAHPLIAPVLVERAERAQLAGVDPNDA